MIAGGPRRPGGLPACLRGHGVTTDGRKGVLGLWGGSGEESAGFWMSVLTGLENRGVRDVFFLVCDGLKGLPGMGGNI